MTDIGDEHEQMRVGLDAVLKETEQKRATDIEEAAREKMTAALKDLNIFATKEEVMSEIKKLREENEAFKQLLLRARAQGKATIQADDAGKDNRLKELFKGTAFENIDFSKVPK